MRTIHLANKIVHLATIQPGDSRTIHALCEHDISLFERCYECEPCTHKGLDFDACKCVDGPKPLMLCDRCAEETPTFYVVDDCDAHVGYRSALLVCERCDDELARNR